MVYTVRPRNRLNFDFHETFAPEKYPLYGNCFYTVSEVVLEDQDHNFYRVYAVLSQYIHTQR